MDKWDKRFLDMAELISTWSKDPSTKVGSVIVDNQNRIVSVGFNGLPVGLDNEEVILKNRELKYRTILHAEENAILFAKQSLDGCTVYTYPFQPCLKCTSVIIQTGIKKVVSFKSDNERWKEEFELSMQHFSEADIEVILYD